MTTANQQLLSSMSPEAARLLDQQLKDQQALQLANTPNAYGGVISGTQGMLNLLSRAGGKEAMGANEAKAIQTKKAMDASKVQLINDAKRNTLFALDNNPAFKKGSEEYEKRKRLIQTTNSIPQLEAMTKFYTPKGQASPSVKVLEDGSVISVSSNNTVSTLKPQALYGFLGRSQKDLEENFSSDSRALAQKTFLEGRKAIEEGTKTEQQVRQEVNKVLQPNLSDFTVERMTQEQQLATGYADFETNLDRTIEALDNANVGTFGGIRQTFAKIYQAVTGEDISSVSDTELVERVLNKEVLNSAQFMKGALSNADMEFLKQSVGTTATSLNGLKEALVELATRKKVAYDVLKDFNSLDNRAKNSFDFEGAKLDKQPKIKEAYYDRFGIKRTVKKSDSVIVPPLLDNQSGKTLKVGERDLVDFFDLPKKKEP